MSLAIQERIIQNKAELRQLRDALAKKAEESRATADLRRVQYLEGEIHADERALAEIRKGQQPYADQSALRRAATPSTSGRVSVSMRDQGHYAHRSQGGGGESWFRDMALSEIRNDEGARRRLQESADIEQRASQTMGTDSQGGYLTPPTTILKSYQDALVAGAPMLRLVTNLELPYNTDSISVPKATSSTSVVYHTELDTITSTPMAFGVESASVTMATGLANLSLQFTEQQATPGADIILSRDFAKQVALKVNGSILKGTSPWNGLYDDAGASVTYTDASPTFGEFLPKLASAANSVATSYYSPPTHVIMHPRTAYALAKELDSTNRPIAGTGLSVENAGLTFDTQGDMDGAVGTILGMRLVLDSSISSTLGAGTNESYVLVLDPTSFFLWSRPPVFEVDRSSGFTNASVNMRARQYVAGSVIHPEAIAKITGTGLAWTP